MKDGFVKVAAYSPEVALAAPKKNAETAVCAMRRAEAEGVKLLVLPELFLTGYTCADLFFQTTLKAAVEEAVETLLKASGDTLVTVVGLPFPFEGKLYNCAAVICGGKLLGIVPKSNIPNYGEFYESRFFAPAPDETFSVTFAGHQTTFGVKQIFVMDEMPAFKLAVEICEDLWVSETPSASHVAAGATVIANLSASDEIVGNDAYRKMLVQSTSARCVCGYVYTSAGAGESTTDLVFSGHNFVAENGVILAESKPFADDAFAVSEIDCEKIISERMRLTSFPSAGHKIYTRTHFSVGKILPTALTRFVDKHPFVPHDQSERDSRCDRILEIQSRGLARRSAAAHAKSLVIGISGGLDSCLALLVAARAAELTGNDNTFIHAVTMPCFGTTARTKSNAEKVCASLGTRFSEIDIKAAVDQHFSDIGQSPECHDVTYENCQARERTQILMDIANKEGGLVVGTGDLSELALGFATYNGDHMSMYGVNASVPKTLVRHIVRRAAEEYEKKGKGELATALLDILATPVSPELLPPKDGVISQVTEDIVGPYELHDFFLYHMVRNGSRPRKIFRLARYAFEGEYDDGTIVKWLSLFVKRFFAQQFKRSCLPDGPKVGSVSLSPRGDYRMPSDAMADAFIAEVQDIEKQIK